MARTLLAAGDRRCVAWFVLAAALPLVLCAAKLNLDLWYDEAYTILYFVSRPWREIVTDYSAPNNHVLYSLLLRPSYLISDSDFFLRLPSLAFTAGALAMTFRVARSLHGLPAAAIATLVLGLNQVFLGHTMQVRGYALSIFLAAWTADLMTAPRDATPRRMAALAVVAAALLYVMPGNALFLAPLIVVAVTVPVMRHGTLRAAIAPGLAMFASAALAGVCYLPIVDDVLALGRDALRIEIADVPRVAFETMALIFRDEWPLLVVGAAGLVAWIVRLRHARDRVDAVLPWLLVVMLFGPWIMTGALRLQPFTRNYTPILPFAALAVGALLAELLALVATRWSRLARPQAMGLLGAALVVVVTLPRLWTYPARLVAMRADGLVQDGYYNYYLARFEPSLLVRYLQQEFENGTPYLTYCVTSDPFVFEHYFLRAGIPSEYAPPASPGIGSAANDSVAPPEGGWLYVIDSVAEPHSPDLVVRGVSVEKLGGLSLVVDSGFHRLYRAARPLDWE